MRKRRPKPPSSRKGKFRHRRVPKTVEHGALFVEDPDDPLFSLRLFGVDPKLISAWNPSGIVTGGERHLTRGLVYIFAQTMQPKRVLADLLGLSHEYLLAKLRTADLAKAWAAGRSAYRISLSMAQRRAALSGEASLLIWLGKQHLGQIDDHRVLMAREQEEEAAALEEAAEEDDEVFTVEVTKKELTALKTLKHRQRQLEGRNAERAG